MAVKRVVSMDFWNDSKVSDMFSVEDKYFMLYLLTNPHTAQLGIYELPISKASSETGYTKDVIKVLLYRFEKVYELIKYNPVTNEVAIKNYLRHSIVKGGKPVMDCLIKEEKKVKDKELVMYVVGNLASHSDDINDTVLDFIKYINNIYKNNIYINDNERIVDESSKQLTELENNFKILYDSYPKKKGRTEAFSRYKLWVTTGKYIDGKRVRLTNKQIWLAISKYKKELEENNTDIQFCKDFSTFMGKQLLDYVEETA